MPKQHQSSGRLQAEEQKGGREDVVTQGAEGLTGLPHCPPTYKGAELKREERPESQAKHPAPGVSTKDWGGGGSKAKGNTAKPARTTTTCATPRKALLRD